MSEMLPLLMSLAITIRLGEVSLQCCHGSCHLASYAKYRTSIELVLVRNTHAARLLWARSHVGVNSKIAFSGLNCITVLLYITHFVHANQYISSFVMCPVSHSHVINTDLLGRGRNAA